MSKRESVISRRLSTYSDRLEAIRGTLRRLGNFRLALFAGAVISATIIASSVGVVFGWSIAAVLIFAFCALVVISGSYRRALHRYDALVRVFRGHRSRLSLDWGGLPQPPDAREADAEHPFEADFDLSGPRSLRRLIDLSVSYHGSALLREWLLCMAPDRGTILERQAIVADLIRESRFRERLTLSFAMVPGSILDSRDLLRWLDRRLDSDRTRRELLVAAILALTNIGMFAATLFLGAPPLWIVSLLIYALHYFRNFERTRSLLEETLRLSLELGKLRTILFFLEKYPRKVTGKIGAILNAFLDTPSRPSHHFRGLSVLENLIGLRMNFLSGFFLNLLLPWDMFCAWRLHRYKEGLRPVLVSWLDTLATLESYLSLATYGWLHPGLTFPSILSDQQIPVIRGVALGHPLIGSSKKIRNSFSMNRTGEVALLSGSNMSGKSTFLRTVGINLCLAYAGGPVDAQEFECVPTRVFACMRANDSVTDGFSLFYAEVRRLRRLLESVKNSEALPVFFVVDELFRGTNNRERLVGGKALIHALAGLNGAGIISTHDLELTLLERKIPGLINYHFREEVVGDTMVFDYRLREGPCPTTNALKIMEMEGLPITVDGELASSG